MMKHVAALILGLLLSSFTWAIESPVAMLKTTSDQMIYALKANHAQIDKNPRAIYPLVQNILVPHVDITVMSKLALGRQYWTAATPTQRQAFQKAFLELMIRTYSTALAAYTNEEIKFKPLRTDFQKQQRVQVDSAILQLGGPPIPVSYRLFQQQDQWKVYDILVDGVSMVQSFHAQFVDEITKGGMDGLLAAMHRHAIQASAKPTRSGS